MIVEHVPAFVVTAVVMDPKHVAHALTIVEHANQDAVTEFVEMLAKKHAQHALPTVDLAIPIVETDFVKQVWVKIAIHVTRIVEPV